MANLQQEMLNIKVRMTSGEANLAAVNRRMDHSMCGSAASSGGWISSKPDHPPSRPACQRRWSSMKLAMKK